MNKKQKELLKKWQPIGDQLQMADFLLVHGRHKISYRAIQKASKSYWNHVGLIFFTPSKKYLFPNTLIIEAAPHGIEIHRIQKYTHNLDKFQLGVKRIPNLTEEERQRILGFMLEYLDTPYDYTRLIGYFLANFISDKFHKWEDKFISQDEFICSTFAQKAIFQAVSKDKQKDVILKPNTTDFKQIEQVSPSDIAHSKNCDWLYNKHY